MLDTEYGYSSCWDYLTVNSKDYGTASMCADDADSSSDLTGVVTSSLGSIVDRTFPAEIPLTTTSCARPPVLQHKSDSLDPLLVRKHVGRPLPRLGLDPS